MYTCHRYRSLFLLLFVDDDTTQRGPTHTHTNGAGRAVVVMGLLLCEGEVGDEVVWEEVVACGGLQNCAGGCRRWLPQARQKRWRKVWREQS